MGSAFPVLMIATFRPLFGPGTRGLLAVAVGALVFG